jgi:two-component system OmpR family sensor kinase
MRLPIRLRLTLVFGIGMAIVLLGLGAYGYSRVGTDLLASVDAGLRARAQVLVDAVGSAQAADVRSADGRLIDPDEAFAQILEGSGRIVEASSGASIAPLLSPSEVSSVADPTYITRQPDPNDDPVRLLAVRVDGSPSQIVVVGATLGDVVEARMHLLRIMGSIGVLALVITVCAGWLLAGAALRPVEEMRREAAAVSASEPARRLHVPRTGDEMERLATTLNSMLDRLQEALERERRFVDDASHELRTPLATLRGEIDLALTRRRDAAELEASLRLAQEDVIRLQRLADDLLVMARMRGGRIPLHRVETSLAGLITRSVRDVEPRAATAGVTIEVDVPDEKVKLDPERMEQALRNLLENAIRHAPRASVVRVSASRLVGSTRFIVADSGPGFPADLLPDAFEPFTRGEVETASSTGAGLGLAIVRAVAEAHGGSVSAENAPDGARVTLDILD